MADQVIQKNFSGGISDDIRQESLNSFYISQHFDMFNSANKLVPYRDWVSDDAGQTGILNFVWDGRSLWGLGISTSPFRVQLYRKIGPTAQWNPVTNGISDTGYLNLPGITFVLYKGFLYHWLYPNSLNRYDIQNDVYTTNFAILGAQNIAQGLVHSKIDALFLPYNNKIGKMDDTVWDPEALVLPSNLVITAVAEFGNYVAIATRPVSSGQTTSKVFLWDGINEDVSEVLDFGEGDLYILGTVGGTLIGVMNEAVAGEIVIPFTGVTFSPQKIFIKTYSGGAVGLLKTLSDTGVLTGYTSGVISTGRSFIQTDHGLSFTITSQGTKVPTGIYTISSVGAGYGLAVTCDRNIFNDTPIQAMIDTIPLPGVQGIFKLGNVWFVSFNQIYTGLANTSARVGRTDDVENYEGISFVETQKYTGGDSSIIKNLLGFSCFYEPLPLDSQIQVLYRVDAETDWTPMYIDNTQGSISHVCINEELNDNGNFKEFKEIQFRIESTGGAVPTGFKFVLNPEDGLLNSN